MDITTAFEAVIPGSNPGGSTKASKNVNCFTFLAFVRQSMLCSAEQNDESGSRKFLSDDEKIICDPVLTSPKQPVISGSRES